ncbi:RNA polymerase sigma factor [Pseudoxanthomonas winnipegensis]|uniref:RNA polymerase sigma factor n=1 Tax=Pseudoxanthomonas winnipegensis TaxID=2480810 RepID=A0A4Q8LTG8_9GAMM|nr:RNA polymerase sigma factor [Pseudoxanthomonas winnipegensis]TAA35169.1 RNA polymerase sigma factor [Pseudoxanthomonas winnipegensis]
MVIPVRHLDQHWLDQHRPALQGFLFRRTGDWSLAEDLVQETFLRMVVYAREHSVTDMGALARTIARNLLHDHLRRRRRQRTEPIDDEVPSPAPGVEAAAMQRQRVEIFARVLQGMPPLRREVFARSRLRGQSYRQIADALGLSEAAVEKHVSRGLRWLQETVARGDAVPPPAACATALRRRGPEDAV